MVAALPVWRRSPSGNGKFDFVAVSYDRTTQTQTLDVNGVFFTSTGTAPPNGQTVLTIGKKSDLRQPVRRHDPRCVHLRYGSVTSRN